MWPACRWWRNSDPLPRTGIPRPRIPQTGIPQTGIPQPGILHLKADARSAGVGLVPLSGGDTAGAVLAIDRQGRIVWQRDLPFGVIECRAGLQGTLLLMGTDGQAREMGLDGRLLHRWHPAGREAGTPCGVPLPVRALCHSFGEIAPDIYLSLARDLEGRDALLRFDRRGSLHALWPLAGSPGHAGAGSPGHAGRPTGAMMDPTDGGVILTLTDPGAVVKLTRDGRPDWHLGPQAAGDGTPELRRPAQPAYTLDGALLIFDGGGAMALRPPHGAGHGGVIWQQAAPRGAPLPGGGVCETGNRSLFLLKGGDVPALLDITRQGVILLRARLSLPRGWIPGRPAHLGPDIARRLGRAWRRDDA